MLQFFNQDRSQINESWLIKEKLNVILGIRVVLLIIVHTIWWFQIYNGQYNILLLFTNLKFLTIWGLNLLHFYLIFAVIDMIYYKVKKVKFSVFWKLEHFIFQFGFSTSLTVIILFWGCVYPSLTNKYTDDSWMMFVNVCYHGIIFIIYYIEFAINNIIFRKKQFILTTIGCALYLVVNIIVTFTYGRVYPLITWVNAISYLYVLAAFIITLFHFWLAMVLYNKFKLPSIQMPFDHLSIPGSVIQLTNKDLPSDNELIKNQQKL
ncbi:hypothetical protein ABPG74_009977 [Tetrahymena malaccensis]